MIPTEQAIAAVLAKYQGALNASDTNAVMPLYATDGVLMPNYSPSSVGAPAVRAAYDAVFKAVSLTVKYTAAEIVETGPEWAFARTTSAGTTTVRATGESGAPVANQELFVFQKVEGHWKIARYCFCTTKPSRA